MPLKRAAHRAAIGGERIIDRFLPAGSNPVLEAYRGYSTPEYHVVRGRVLTKLRHATPHADQSRWVNLRQMISLFLTYEVADVTVVAPDHGVEGVSDEEGYFTLEVPRGAEVASDWLRISCVVEGSDAIPTPFPVRVPSPEARFGVISDVDDTMIRTGAYSLAKNLWTTFTGSALTREVFADSVALIEALGEGGRNPVHYVSSSPWNLHHFLDTLFARAQLTPGPMFLRDLGVSETQFISGTHGDHKGRAIDTILGAHPGLPFVLIGDTGQHDAHVYADAVARHPGRILAVVLREPGPGPDADSSDKMRKIEEQGVAVLHGATFDGFGPHLMDGPLAKV